MQNVPETYLYRCVSLCRDLQGDTTDVGNRFWDKTEDNFQHAPKKVISPRDFSEYRIARDVSRTEATFGLVDDREFLTSRETKRLCGSAARTPVRCTKIQNRNDAKVSREHDGLFREFKRTSPNITYRFPRSVLTEIVRAVW